MPEEVQKVRKHKVLQPRNDAIVIATASGRSNADILIKITAEPHLKELGQSEQAVRRTAKGELLFLLNKVSSKNTVSREIARILSGESNNGIRWHREGHTKSHARHRETAHR